MSANAHGVPTPRAEQPRARLTIVRAPEPLSRNHSYAEVQRDAALYRIQSQAERRIAADRAMERRSFTHAAIVAFVIVMGVVGDLWSAHSWILATGRLLAATAKAVFG